jgi:exosortase/archaeosortase family protein
MDGGSTFQISAASRQSPTESLVWRALSGLMSRDELFVALLIIPCVNAFAGRALETSREFGWAAISASFYVSAIVWLALLAALTLVLRPRERQSLRPSASRVRIIDLIVATAVFSFAAFPSHTLSWLGLTLAAAHVSRCSPTGSPLQRGSLILLAITAPMFWGPALMHAYFEPFQKFDALLVSAMTGTERVGGMVRLADGSGYLVIAHPCSSFHNISHAMLAMVTVTQFVGSKRIAATLGWSLLACASAVTVNIARISLIGLYPAHQEITHGPIGKGIAGWVTFGLVALICYLGVRRDLFAQR